MRKSTKICLIIVSLLLATVAVVTAIWFSTHHSLCDDPTYPTIENAADLYENAINLINDKKNITLHITYKKELFINNETLTEESTQHIVYYALGTDKMQARVAETLSIGSYAIEITEIFHKGTMYTTVNGSRFSGAIPSKDFTARYFPTVPLNSSLYKSISGINTGHEYIISFSDPTHVELWLNEEGTTLEQASGSAYIDDSGYLTKSSYTASYSINGIPAQLSATVELEYEDTAQIQIPKNRNEFTELTDPTAPKLLEKSCGYLLGTTNIGATITENILCEAFGDQRKQTISLKTSQSNDWSAQIDTTIELINNSKTGAVSNHSQTEQFANNTYYISTDNGPLTKSNDVDIDTMRNHCRDLLVGTIILQQHIAEAVIADDNDAYTIELTGNEIIAQLLDAEACSTLYQDATILTSTAQDHQIENIKYYLVISKKTGFPLSSGFEYQGIYTIEDLPYHLIFKSEQEYIIGN